LSPLALSLRCLHTQSDAQLANLAGEGHERAFEALVRRYRKPLLAYCRRSSPADISAEDILQQALLQAWIAIRTGIEVRDPRAWLYRIVHNVAISSQRRPRVIPVDLPDAAVTDGADHQAEQRMAAREALERLASLPKMQREVMVGTAVDGLSHEELASALGLSSGAVRGLIYRARATLRTAAAALFPGPLIGWTIRHAGGTRASGLVEALAGGGSAGLGDFLFKGGAIAATAGAIATAGITIDPDAHRHHAGARHSSARAHQLTTPRAGRQASASTRTLVADRLRPARQFPPGQAIERGDRHKRDRGDRSGGEATRAGGPGPGRLPGDEGGSGTSSAGEGSRGQTGGHRGDRGSDHRDDSRLSTAGTPLAATPDDGRQRGGGSGSGSSGGPRDTTATGQVTTTSTAGGGEGSGGGGRPGGEGSVGGGGPGGGSPGGGDGPSGGSPSGGDGPSGGSPSGGDGSSGGSPSGGDGSSGGSPSGGDGSSGGSPGGPSGGSPGRPGSQLRSGTP
jgi:RNA polymerase sigma factor (sigma-70 family)